MAGTLTISAVAPQESPTLAGLLSAMSADARLRGALLAGLSAIALIWLAQTAYQSMQAPASLPLAQAVAAPVQTESVAFKGIVQSIRELPAEGDSGARRFEMTIRMRDGTTRISNETGGAQWHVGDKIMLMGTQAKH